MAKLFLLISLAHCTVCQLNCGDGVDRSLKGKAVASPAQRLAEAFASHNDLSSWVNPNGTFGGQNDYSYVAVVYGILGLVPKINLQDGPQGVRNALDCCTTARALHSFPAAAALGAAMSPDLAYYHAKLGALDWLQIKAQSALAPGTEVTRLPTNGRNWEYVSGEDASLGSIASDIIKGIQSHNLLPTLKHFGFNQQELNRGADSESGNIAILDEEVAMEIYMRAYQDSIDAGAGGMMCSYNQVQFLRNGFSDGSHSCACGSLALMSLLRDAMGYGGLVMSDWGAQFTNYTADGANHSGRENVDWEMVWSRNHSGLFNPLASDSAKAVAIKRALTGLFLSGAMESCGGKAPTPAPPPEKSFPASYAAAIAGSDVDKFETLLLAEALTLLKNDGALPIRASNQRILLLGEAMLSGGGSGDAPAFAYLFPNNTAEGISNNGGLHAQRLMQKMLADALHATVSWDFDLSSSEDNRTNDFYASFDYIIVFGSQYRGEAYMTDGKDGYYDIGRCSSRENWSYAASQSKNANDRYGNCDYPALMQDLAHARKSGAKLISVTTVGGVFSAYGFIDHVDAAITTFYPGQYFAAALAAVMSGDISPGGKLTHTLPTVETFKGEQYIQSPIGRFNPGLKVPSTLCVNGSALTCLNGAKNTILPPALAWDFVKNDYSDIIQYGYESSNYSEGRLNGYKYYEKYGMQPLFPFGYGLSYGKWHLEANFEECQRATSCKVAVQVHLDEYPVEKVVSNVIQLYLGYRPGIDASPRVYPVKELRAFQKVWGSTHVSFQVDLNTAWNLYSKLWTTPCRRDGTPGIFTISVGFSSTDIIGSHDIACDLSTALNPSSIHALYSYTFRQLWVASSSLGPEVLLLIVCLVMFALAIIAVGCRRRSPRSYYLVKEEVEVSDGTGIGMTKLLSA